MVSTTQTPTPMHRREPLIGIVLGGRYRIDAPLGRGGTGRVFRGTQLNIGRTVAIKVLRFDLAPEARELFELRFLREASRAGALAHPNVVTIHDFDRTDDGTCYIVMEMVRGRSLAQAIAEGPMQPARVLAIFEQMVSGLRAAHAAGMIHRDVKPGNILLVPDPDGRDFVKLVDFGLVKATQDKTVTADGVFLGTPNYVAPEQARGLGGDHRSDLYSTGVVMYRCLTGRLPFEGDNPTSVVMAHIRQPYPPMSSRNAEVQVPEEVEAIVRKCLPKDPLERFADAGEMLRAIRRVRFALYPDYDLRAPTPPPPTVPLAVEAPSRTSEEVRRVFFGALTGWFGRRRRLGDPMAARPLPTPLRAGIVTALIIFTAFTGLVLLRTGLRPTRIPIAPAVEEGPAATAAPTRSTSVRSSAAEQDPVVPVRTIGTAPVGPEAVAPPSSLWGPVDLEAGSVSVVQAGPAEAEMLSGSWSGRARGEEVHAELKFGTGGMVTGVIRSVRGNRETTRRVFGEHEVGDRGVVEVQFTETEGLRPATWTGTITDDRLDGQVEARGREVEGFSLVRAP